MLVEIVAYSSPEFGLGSIFDIHSVRYTVRPQWTDQRGWGEARRARTWSSQNLLDEHLEFDVCSFVAFSLRLEGLSRSPSATLEAVASLHMSYLSSSD